jgi:hypothetical protein
MRGLIAVILLVIVGMALRRALAEDACSSDGEGPARLALLSLTPRILGVLASLRELV